MTIIKGGGQLSTLKDQKLEEITVGNDGNSRIIELRINDSSLSYLTIEEALDLRDELNSAIGDATKIGL